MAGGILLSARLSAGGSARGFLTDAQVGITPVAAPFVTPAGIGAVTLTATLNATVDSFSTVPRATIGGGFELGVMPSIQCPITVTGSVGYTTRGVRVGAGVDIPFAVIAPNSFSIFGGGGFIPSLSLGYAYVGGDHQANAGIKVLF